MRFHFQYNEDIDLELPVFNGITYDDLTKKEKEEFHMKVELISSSIKPKISELEKAYMEIYESINDENVFEYLDKLNVISRKISLLNLTFYKMQGYFIQSD